MRATFEIAKVIVDGENSFLCIGVPYRDAKKFVGEMKPRKYVAEIKEYREKRSLDANAYCWVMIGKLAAALSNPWHTVTPEEIYREAIKDVGDNYEVMPVRDDALERWKAIWTRNGIGWLCDELGPSKIPGYTNVRNFYGSSVYDKSQMSRLINIIVEDCKAQGIETMTPDELARLTEGWE